MKYVTFHRLKIKNFLSVGEDEVVVDFKKGLHIITGINRDKEDRRNGVGKSTIADALYFAIFGSTIRDIKKEFIPNNLTSGECRVEVSFNVNSPKGNNEFVVVRTLNPSRLHIYKDGMDKTRDSIANTTEYIGAVLSSSQEVFHNCVIMTVNNTLPFMAKSKVEKRKFIEQIFNLQVFSEMLSKLRDDINQINKTFDIETTKHSEIEKSIQTYLEQKQLRVKEREEKISNINNKIKSNTDEIYKLQDELSKSENIDLNIKQTELQTLTKAYDTVDEKIKGIISQVAECNATVKQKQAQLSNIGTSADICPTCLRPIDSTHRDHIRAEKDKLGTDIKDHSLKCETLSAQVESFKDRNKKIRTHINKINDDLNVLKVKLENRKVISKRIQDLTDLNTQLFENIQHLNEHGESFNDVINQTKERLEAVRVEIENIKKIINLLDVVKFVVSEEGVKSYIVKKILQNFNSKLAYYLKRLDSNSICVFNEYFVEEILNEKGKMCDYNNFSGAERKAIDLACLFSFMDMRKSQGNVHYNISIYDELLDSSLDEKGVDIVLEMLKERCEKHNECIFIISHRKESIKAATGEIVFLEKHNGITKRVNFVE
jgi:DNA repair exonuclease SbcCD ATPase subunit